MTGRGREPYYEDKKFTGTNEVMVLSKCSSSNIVVLSNSRLEKWHPF